MRTTTRHTANANRTGVRAPRVLSLVSAAITIGLLVSSCGGSSPSPSAGGQRPAAFGQRFVAFAACMCSHGLADYPDPQISSSGDQVHVKISPGSLDPKSPAFKSASQACHHLLPNGGAPAGGASPQEQPQALKFAVCMRSHGVPSFPDPDHDGAFDLPSGITPQATQFQRAVQACMKVEPSSLSINQGPSTSDALAGPGGPAAGTRSAIRRSGPSSPHPAVPPRRAAGCPATI
jgi:hypothetical protein